MLASLVVVGVRVRVRGGVLVLRRRVGGRDGGGRRVRCIVGAGRDLNSRDVLNVVQDAEELRLDVAQVLRRVEVLHVRHGHMQAVVGPVVLKVVVVGQGVLDFCAEEDGGFVSPNARHVAQRVPAAPEDEHRDVEALHVLDAVRVPAQRQVEAAEAVARERVRAALEHDGRRLVHLDDFGDDRLEDRLVGNVVHAVLQRKVDRVVLAPLRPDVGDVARAREEIAVLVEGDGHHAVRAVKCLLDAVAVVDVDVDVEDARVVLQQLQNRQDDVVDVTKTRSLRLFRVVEASRPIDGNVGIAGVELRRAVERGSRVHGAKLEDAVVDGAVRLLADVELLHLLQKRPNVVGRHALQKVDVVVGVESRKLSCRCKVRTVHIQFPIKPHAQQQVVRQL
mmetsp:Transcript_30866/g.106707  ORF Transcript_30866/g.106707 Transcript_30866/m.106707 type:complete len:392 (+) Transcript_30866:254-1429(+)